MGDGDDMKEQIKIAMGVDDSEAKDCPGEERRKRKIRNQQQQKTQQLNG